MSDAMDLIHRAIDEDNAHESTQTRRELITKTTALVGGMSLLAVPGIASAQRGGSAGNNTPENILTVAATAEVLATIVNTVGHVRGLGGDRTTRFNIAAAARQELIHYNTLTSLGARPLTKKIWVPDAVFANRTNFLNTLEVGDQIFVNAYLIGVTAFGQAGDGRLARIAAEFMGVEAVHRAAARQSLGKLGNDRAYMKYNGRETAPGAPNRGDQGFTDILRAAALLQAAGFGFGERSSAPGRFYNFDAIKRRTPNPPGVNTRAPQ
ncbi:MAG: ferritin-like domain-containing protein [Miltoncostaeaceae bacterium]